MRFSRLVRTGLAVALLAVGCGGPPRESAGPKAPLAEEQPSAAIAQPLVTHEVHASDARAALLRRYAEETGLEARSEAGITKVGPVLSFFEASWLAGLVPGGAVARRETYDEPASPAPFARLREAAGRVPTYVGLRRVAGERFALVTWEGDGEQKDQELYQTNAGGPRFLERLPARPALGSSSGMLFTKVGDEGTILQVLNETRADKVKAERLLAWRFTMGARETLFEVPFFSLQLPSETTKPTGAKPADAKPTDAKPPKEEPKVLVVEVTRLAPEGAGVRMTSFRVTLRALEASESVPLALNEWSHERWKDKEPPDLVEMVKVERIGERRSSLE
jgi:hypothetical protein